MRLRSWLTLIIVGGLIYSNSVNVPFQLDDQRNINHSLLRAFSEPLHFWMTNPTRSFANLTFATNYLIHQEDVLGYHLVNITIHIINGILFFEIVRSLLHRLHKSEHQFLKKKQLDTLSVLVALIFLAHPLQTQAVTYIVQRYASLASLGVLLGVWSYLRYKHTQNVKIKISYVVLSFLAYLMAIQSKIIAFPLPLLLIFIEILIFKKKISTKLLFTIGIVLIIVISIFSIRYPPKVWLKTRTTIDRYEVTSPDYLMTQLSIYPRYLGLWLYPTEQSVDHQVEISNIRSNSTQLGILMVIVLLCTVLIVRKHMPLVALGIAWITVTMIIESSFFTISDLMFEHRLYLPSVGFCLSITGFAVYFLNKHMLAYRSLVIIFLIWISLLSLLTIRRNQIWQTPVGLWADAVVKAPQKVRPRLNYAAALQMDGDLDAALQQYLVILQIDPDKYEAWSNLAAIYATQNQWNLSLESYQKALEIEPTYVDALVGIGVVYMNQGNYDLALDWLTQAKQVDPHSLLVEKNLELLTKKINQEINSSN